MSTEHDAERAFVNRLLSEALHHPDLDSVVVAFGLFVNSVRALTAYGCPLGELIEEAIHHHAAATHNIAVAQAETAGPSVVSRQVH
jgi:hypothetical protein